MGNLPIWIIENVMWILIVQLIAVGYVVYRIIKRPKKKYERYNPKITFHGGPCGDTYSIDGIKYQRPYEKYKEPMKARTDFGSVGTYDPLKLLCPNELGTLDRFTQKGNVIIDHCLGWEIEGFTMDTIKKLVERGTYRDLFMNHSNCTWKKISDYPKELTHIKTDYIVGWKTKN